jgi:hypothetical protein
MEQKNFDSTTVRLRFDLITTNVRTQYAAAELTCFALYCYGFTLHKEDIKYTLFVKSEVKVG